MSGAVPPERLAAVGVDELLLCLDSLKQPLTFYDHGQRIEPDERDIGQVLGAVAASLERVIAHRQLAATPEGRRGFASGYLMALGAQTPCGVRTTLDHVLLRIRHTADLVEGYSGEMGPAVRSSLDALTMLLTITSEMHHGDGEPTPERVDHVAGLFREGYAALDATRVHLDALMAGRAQNPELP